MIFIISIFLSFYSQATEHSCTEQSLGDQRLKICAEISDRSKNPDIVFFFHGLNGNEGSYEKNHKMILEKLWNENSISPPTVVSISLGPLWLTTDVDANGNLFSVFKNLVIPNTIETLGGYKPLNATRRGNIILMGESMGGYNAALLFLKAPNNYAKAAFLCPAWFSISPFSTNEEIQDYISSTGADPARIQKILPMIKTQFPDDASWIRNDPIQLAANNTSWFTSPMYLSVGEKDEWGFQEGAGWFRFYANIRLASLEFHQISEGKHCSVDYPALAEFLRP